MVFRPKSLGLYRPTIHVITVTFFTFFKSKNVTFTVVCLALGLHVFSNYDIRCKLKLRIFVRGAVVVVAFEAVMKIVKK